MKKYMIREAELGAKQMVLTKQAFYALYLKIRCDGGQVVDKGAWHAVGTCNHDKNKWEKFACSYAMIQAVNTKKVWYFEISESLMNGY